MKRLILTAVALSMLAVPAAQAQSRHAPWPQQNSIQRHAGAGDWNKKTNQRIEIHKETVRKHVARKHGVVVKPRWARGKQVPAWQRQHVVRDYGRYGLRRPALGHQWVKVDSDYLLVSIASGVIAGIVANR
jgi:Ni/Co efflux regulator RcnB